MNAVSPWRRGQLGLLLDNGGVIAYPTEGVWGLGCLPDSEEAVMRLLELKQRDWREGLLLVAASMQQLAGYLDGLNDGQLETLSRHWPGPVTYLVPDNGLAPAWIVGDHDTLGLRVSAHPVVRQLCHWFGPLVSTSANISGHPSALNSLEVNRYFGNGLDALVPGRLGGADGPSRIIHLESGAVIR